MRRYDGNDAMQRESGTIDAIASAKRGELVVVNADSAYVVIADAFSERGVARLRALKQRPDMTLPVFVGKPETVDGISPLIGEAGRVARALMTACWPGALTIIGRAQPSLAWTCTPNGTVAMRMPAHPWTLDVVRGIGPTASVPVHNHDAEPVVGVDAVEALLGDAVAVCMDGGPCAPAAMSSIVDATEDTARLVRAGALTLEYLRTLAPELNA